eukprot:g22582.t1
MKAVLENIDVVCATCIGCGMGPLDSRTFPFIVIDEAAQVIEPAVILPLGKGAVQAVMVGDQCQLPATVLSQEAQSKGLDISMFDRLLSMGMEYTLLSDQYRMHPSISAFPSWRFYRGELKNAVTDADRPMPPGLPFRSSLEQVMQSGIRPEHIGIISPYGAQVKLIQRSLPYNAQMSVQVSTVDAFQGSEREVIILSLVRANRRGDVGFVADWRRLNVALSRARRLCVVVGNIPTWLNSSSALIRDWLGFHQVGKADVRAFRGYVTDLPMDVAAKVNALRQDFITNNPAPAKLSRAEKAARNVSAAGKKAREITQALEDAIKAEDEAVLKSVISQAKEAGIEKSIIDEAETTLESLGQRPNADKIDKAEALMNELVVPSEEHGRSFYAPAPKKPEAEKGEEPEEKPAKKKPKNKSWAGLLNTGPKYAGRRRDEEDDAPPPPEGETVAVIEDEPVPEVKEGKGKAGKGKDGKGKGKGKSEPEKPYLVVDAELGAGVELTATCWGMHVDLVEEKPGQPHLVAGSTITAIGGHNLLGLADEDAVATAFGEHFKHEALIDVDPATFETLELPPEASTWPLSFQEDLEMLANKFAIDCSISKLGLELAGPSVAMEPAKMDTRQEMQQLLDFYLKGQAEEKQKQVKVDQEAMKLAIRHNQERQQREAQEWAAWQAYVLQMQETYTAYAMAAQQAWEQQVMQQMAMQQAQPMQQFPQQSMYQNPMMGQQMGMQQPMHQMQQMQPQMQPMQQMAPMHSPWVMYYNQQGQPYYYNEQTGEQVWQLPPGATCSRQGNAPDRLGSDRPPGYLRSFVEFLKSGSRRGQQSLDAHVVRSSREPRPPRAVDAEVTLKEGTAKSAGIRFDFTMDLELVSADEFDVGPEDANAEVPWTLRQALAARPDGRAAPSANHWRFPASSYIDEWNPDFRCRVNGVPSWVLKHVPAFATAAEQVKATAALRLSAATRRLLAELPPAPAPSTPAGSSALSARMLPSAEDLKLDGLGGTLLPFQVEAVQYGLARNGYQSALAESLLELLGIEAEIYGDKERYHHECIHHLVLGRPLGDSSYANYCHCWREQLDRLTGSDRDRSRWVQFWDGRKGPEVGFLLASIFLHRATYEDRTRGTGYLPRHTWSREKHQRYVEAWIPDEFEFGDAVDNELTAVPRNGSKAEIKDAFLAAGEEGRRQWHEFKTGLQAEAGLPAVWRMPSSLEASVQDHLDDAACNWLLLGDEMGLGKTVTTLALVRHFKESWPFLVVAPAPLCKLWQEHALAWLKEDLKPHDVVLIRSAQDPKQKLNFTSSWVRPCFAGPRRTLCPNYLPSAGSEFFWICHRLLRRSMWRKSLRGLQRPSPRLWQST